MKDKNLSLSSKANDILIIPLCLLKQSDQKNKGKITATALSLHDLTYIPYQLNGKREQRVAAK